MTPEQLRAVSLAQPSPSETVSEDDLVAIGRRAQRAQWFAIAGVTTASFFNVRPVVQRVERLTAPGVPWVISTVLMTAAGMSATDAIIHTLQPPRRTGRWTTRLTRINHASVIGCSLLTIVPWLVQRPRPRPRNLQEYVTYYSPDVAGFVAALGPQICGPFQAATLFFSCWNEARREPDPAVRVSLRLVAIGSVVNQGVILIQTVQAYTWMQGRPRWTPKQAAVAQMACQIATPLLLLLGSSTAPFVENVRARSAEFFTQLWREDVVAMRAPWRLLQGVYRTAYELETDQTTKTSRDELYAQRARMASDIMEALIQAADDLTPQARRRIEQLLGRRSKSTVRQRTGRVTAAAARSVLSVVGGFAPILASRWWRQITEKPLQRNARADAASASAALQFHTAGSDLRDERGISSQATPVLTLSPRDVDEAVAYLRLLWREVQDHDVLEAGTAGFVEMVE
ncbi:hypothetical protein [Kineococcus radiotolerans]|nr:hypothetical protein [Kineococcus radiotolerans]